MRVLLVSHEATRSGAPRIAVEIAEALRQRGCFVRTLLRWDGPLGGDLAAASSAFTLEPLRRTRALARKVFPRAQAVNRLEEAIAFLVLKLLRPTVVYANTVKSACYLRPALRLGLPVVLHVHELEPLASDTLRRYRLDGHYPDVTLVACSDAAAENLARLAGVPVERVTTIPSLVDIDRVVELAQVSTPSARSHVSGQFVVGACGVADERKGVDLWLEAAATVVRLRPHLDLRFVWVGKHGDDAIAQRTELGLADRVLFTGTLPNPFPDIAEMDVFCLPSRSDPFPLVVLEAMALGRPVVAFDVGGVAEQLGDTGRLVPPGETAALAEAIVGLLDDADARRTIGKRGAQRIREHFAIDEFRRQVGAVIYNLAPHEPPPPDPLRFPALPSTLRSRTAFLLQSFDASSLRQLHDDAPCDRRLPYRAEWLTSAGWNLELSDEHLGGRWQREPLRTIVSRLERMSAPFLQALVSWRSIARSDATIAMFESQGNAVAALRAARIPPFSRPRFFVLACWLARDVEHFGPVRRALYSICYRSIDRIIFFSENQTEILASALKLERSQLRSVPFGVDHEYFAPVDVAEEGYIAAVGRDLGRDWATLFEAVRGSDLRVKVACRPHTLEGLDIPENVEVLGYIDRARYRDLLARAALVVVTTRDLRYPTGQSVTLEAMAMAKCCVVTDTEPMREYVRDGSDGLLVSPGDVAGLRATLLRAVQDAALRQELGASARRRVETEFNARLMWERIGEIMRASCAERPSTNGEREDASSAT